MQKEVRGVWRRVASQAPSIAQVQETQPSVELPPWMCPVSEIPRALEDHSLPLRAQRLSPASEPEKPATETGWWACSCGLDLPTSR